MFSGIFRTIAVVFSFFAVLTNASFAQQAETRFAFVIGNDGYEQGALPTAANDAALVADALRLAGFDVTGARNLDQDTLRASYREFLAKVSAAGPGAVSAIYISGHGIQFEGENYLVPVGAAITRESDIGLHSVRLSDLTRPLAGLNGRANILMFDLAYESPLAKLGQGVAPGLSLMEPEAGSLISFNAAPGMYAPVAKPPYGAYAQAVSEMIRVGNLTADELMDRIRLRVVDLTKNQQVPWHQSRITPPLTLLVRGADAPAPQISQDKVDRLQTGAIKDLGPKEGYAAAVKRDRLEDYREYAEAYPDTREAKRARAMMAARREALIWSRTVSRHTPAAYYTYLKQYPRGPHAADARRRLARLSQPVEIPQSFDQVDYDVPPPPPEESVYFESRVPSYFDDSDPVPVEIIETYAPPPRWWAPPPPPVFDDEDDYFLAAPQVITPVPDWVAPPMYVAEPVMPYGRQDRSAGDVLRSVAPYVAIPAALAAGIAAGKLLSRKQDRVNAPGGGTPPIGGRPTGINPPVSPNLATAPPVGARPPRVMPPVTLPPGQTHSAPATRVNAPGGVIRPPATTTAPTTTTTQPATTVPPVVRPTVPPTTTAPATSTTQPATTVPPVVGRPTVPPTTTAPATTTTQPATTVPPVVRPTVPPTTTGPAITTTQPATTLPPVVGRPTVPPTTTAPATTTTQPGTTNTRPPVTTPPVVGRPTAPPTTTAPATTTTAPAAAEAQRRALEAQRQQQLQQQRAAEQARQQQQREQQRAAEQAQRQQRDAERLRQEQVQQQRTQQLQQQLQQKRAADAARQQQLQQQRQQQVIQQQQRQQQQLQQQRQQQVIQQQQRQQQVIQQQRQQQLIQQQQQQRQQQLIQQQQQQRQQQLIQQQRQQQLIQQQRQQQRPAPPQQRRCGQPGLPPCP